MYFVVALKSVCSRQRINFEVDLAQGCSAALSLNGWTRCWPSGWTPATCT